MPSVEAPNVVDVLLEDYGVSEATDLLLEHTRAELVQTQYMVGHRDRLRSYLQTQTEYARNLVRAMGWELPEGLSQNWVDAPLIPLTTEERADAIPNPWAFRDPVDVVDCVRGGYRTDPEVTFSAFREGGFDFPDVLNHQDWTAASLVRTSREQAPSNQDPAPQEPSPTAFQLAAGSVFCKMYQDAPQVLASHMAAFLADALGCTLYQAHEHLQAGPQTLAEAFAVRGIYRTEEDFPSQEEQDKRNEENAQEVHDSYISSTPQEQAFMAKTFSQQWEISFEETERILNDPKLILSQVENVLGFQKPTSWDMLEEE